MSPLRRQPQAVYSVHDAEPHDLEQGQEWEQPGPGDGHEQAGGAGRAARRLLAPGLLCMVLALAVGLLASAILKGGQTRGAEPVGASTGEASSLPATADARKAGHAAERRRRGRGVIVARAAASGQPASSVPRGRAGGDRSGRLAEKGARASASDSAAAAPQVAQPPNAAPAHLTSLAPVGLDGVAPSSESEVVAPVLPRAACACGSAVDEFGFER